MDCAELKGDICERWEVCLDLLLQGIQHPGRLHFSESDSPAESSQKLRVLSKHGSCDADLVGKLSGESFFHLLYRNVRAGLTLKKIEIVAFPPLK